MAEPHNPSPQDDDQVPGAAEAWSLIDLLLDGEITEEGCRRLEELVTGDNAIARIYIRAMHVWSQLPLHLGARQETPPAWQAQATKALLSETMVMDALKLEATPENDFEQDIFQPASALPVPPRNPTVWERIDAAKKWLGIAAAVILCPTLAWLFWPKGPAAVVTATAGIELNGGAPLKPGSRLTDGQSIDITRGAMELRFRSGATVTISGPAQFSIDPGNAMSLHSGMLAARVPHSAVGFSVGSPGLKVVDLGTSFGIRTVEDDHGSEAAVFEGKVTAAATDPEGQGMSAPVSLTASTATVHSLKGGSTLLPASYHPDQYLRDISKFRLPLALFNTGAELTSNDTDAHWQVQQVPMQPDWIAQQADIFHPTSAQMNLLMGSCICPHGAANPPQAGEYVFRTTVDLSGFDPQSALVVARIFATEAIIDVRINGSQALGISLLDTSRGQKVGARTLQLPSQFWKTGINVVDFVVNYLPEDMPRYVFPGLSVSWDASASPVVYR